jgi:peptidoglycan/LPS O-acetylase OafA/YrhL
VGHLSNGLIADQKSTASVTSEGVQGSATLTALKPDRPSDIPSLTGIRGILALWVVVYHFSPDIFTLFPICSILAPIINKGHFAVPAFFILSGVVLAHNYQYLGRSPKRNEVLGFLIKRLARIYPVHFVSLMVVLAMVVVSRNRGWSIAESGYTLKDFILNLFLVHTWVPHFTLNWNYPSWSISSEWFAYLFFCPLMIICHRLSSRLVLVALALSVTSSLAIYYSPKETWFRELLCVVPTFMWGAIIVVSWTTPRNSKRAAQLELILQKWAFVPVVAVLISCLLPSPYDTGCLLFSLGSLIFSIYVAGNDNSIVYDFWPVRFLGEVSYSLYMTHTLAQKILYQLLPAGTYVDSALFFKLLVSLAYFLLIVAFTMVMYYLVERPARKFSRAFSSRA